MTIAALALLAGSPFAGYWEGEIVRHTILGVSAPYTCHMDVSMDGSVVGVFDKDRPGFWWKGTILNGHFTAWGFENGWAGPLPSFMKQNTFTGTYYDAYGANWYVFDLKRK